MKFFLEKILKMESLNRAESETVIESLIEGKVPTEQMASLLTALRMKGETVEELLGFIDGLRKQAIRVDGNFGELIDVCGTGGDGASTFNVSTGVAIILGSMGVKVAKHGNRGVSSASGSYDVLQALGLKSDLTPLEAEASIRDRGLSFLFAPAFHPVLSRIATLRKSLGIYTIFNALGPLLNPAPLTRQMVGVYSESLLEKTAIVLRDFGMKEAFVVHGSDGLDEITISGPTGLMHLKDGVITKRIISPADFGLNTAPLSSVKGGDSQLNAKILMNIFAGEKSPARDLLVMNAAAALVLINRHSGFSQAAREVESTLDQKVTELYLSRLKSERSA